MATSGSDTDAQRRRDLHGTLDESGIRNLLALGRQLDVRRGGRHSYYDARSGCANIWCGPEDKPACWDVPITASAYPLPRDYVGELAWDWNEDVTEASLYVTVDPYDMLEWYDDAGVQHTRQADELSAEDWRELLDWTARKALWLVQASQQLPAIVGTHCPFCAYVLPVGYAINDLIEHIAAVHPGQKVESLVAGEQAAIVTDQDAYPLIDAHEELR